MERRAEPEGGVLLSVLIPQTSSRLHEQTRKEAHMATEAGSGPSNLAINRVMS